MDGYTQGHEVTITDPRAAIKLGMGYVSEEMCIRDRCIPIHLRQRTSRVYQDHQPSRAKS